MGALSDGQDNSGNSEMQLLNEQQYMQNRDAAPQTGALNQAAAYGSGSNVATDDEGNPGEYSPQDQRTLLLLDSIRGQLAPKHTGNAWAEGYGQVAEDQYRTLSGIMSANAKARAAMTLQGMKNQGSLGVADVRGGASRDVANINAGKNAQRVLTEQEARQMGLDVPPGWSGTINAFGKVTTVNRPNASQVQAVGETGGMTDYARPGQVITPAQRSMNEKYINAAHNVMPYLDETKPDSLFSKLQDPQATSALGGPGMMERGANAVEGLFGSNTNLSPNDTDLRAEIKTFNRQAVQLYKTVPGNENLSPAQLEAFEKDNLPDPDNKLESRPSAFAKMNAFKKMVATRLGTAQSAMQGHGNYGGDTPAATNGTPAASAAPQYTPDQIQEELARRGLK